MRGFSAGKWQTGPWQLSITSHRFLFRCKQWCLMVQYTKHATRLTSNPTETRRCIENYLCCTPVGHQISDHAAWALQRGRSVSEGHGCRLLGTDLPALCSVFGQHHHIFTRYLITIGTMQCSSDGCAWPILNSNLASAPSCNVKLPFWCIWYWVRVQELIQKRLRLLETGPSRQDWGKLGFSLDFQGIIVGLSHRSHR